MSLDLFLDTALYSNPCRTWTLESYWTVCGSSETQTPNLDLHVRALTAQAGQMVSNNITLLVFFVIRAGGY